MKRLKKEDMVVGITAAMRTAKVRDELAELFKRLAIAVKSGSEQAVRVIAKKIVALLSAEE